MRVLRHIIREYRNWRYRWDDLCDRCGNCCYKRSYSKKSGLITDFSAPCRYLDEETHQCRVYENRFSKNDRCGNMSLYYALFNPLLPHDCAYVRTFRIYQRRGCK